jgi:hypothetical protein
MRSSADHYRRAIGLTMSGPLGIGSACGRRSHGTTNIRAWILFGHLYCSGMGQLPLPASHQGVQIRENIVLSAIYMHVTDMLTRNPHRPVLVARDSSSPVPKTLDAQSVISSSHAHLWAGAICCLPLWKDLADLF